MVEILYPARRVFPSGKFFGMYKDVCISGTCVVCLASPRETLLPQPRNMKGKASVSRVEMLQF